MSILIQVDIIINFLISSLYVDVLSLLTLRRLCLYRSKLKSLASEGKLHVTRQYEHCMNEQFLKKCNDEKQISFCM